MFCQVCGKTISSLEATCPHCNQHPRSGRSFCPNCGNATNPAAVLCVSCGAALTPPQQSNPNIGTMGAGVQPSNTPTQPFSNPSPYPPQYPPAGGPGIASAASNRVPAGVLALLFGCFGVHKFMMGYTNEGIIMAAIGVVGGIFTCGIATAVIGLIGFIEGIIYLTKTDEDFVNTYVVNRKGWF